MKKRSIFSTVVHEGLSLGNQQPIAAIPSISPSVGYLYDSYEMIDDALGSDGGTCQNPMFVYARHGAPNAALLEGALGALEGAIDSVIFSSGMAALHAAFTSLIPSGGKVLAASELYGATRSILSYISRLSGVSVHFHDFSDITCLEEGIRQVKPDLMICETISNPLCRALPVDEILGVASRTGVISVVDNTFATPYLCRPLELGASIVIHSTTKALNGHGDVLGGVVSGNDLEQMRKIRDNRKLLGAMPGPFDCWLTLRGLRTFALRMRQSCETALKIASFLNSHPTVNAVHYPGLPSSEDYRVAKRIFGNRGFGSMIAFSLQSNSRKASAKFIDSLQLIRPVTSLISSSIFFTPSIE